MPEHNRLVRYTKVPSLAVYFAGMLAMLVAAFDLLRGTWRDFDTEPL
jgi:hypothetical protein